jgi:hypothetical protein
VPEPLPEYLTQKLASFLGPHTAKNAIRVFAQKAVNKSPTELSPADVEPLLQALRPMLRTLIGARESEQLLNDIRKEVRP